MYRSSFKKELRRIASKERQLVTERILSLANNPRPHGVTKLQGSEKLYRIRQGDYRVIYAIEDKIVTIEVIKVGHRKDVYEK